MNTLHIAQHRKMIRNSSYRALAVMGLVFGIIVAQVLLSVTVASGAYEISDKKTELKELSRTYEQVTQHVNALQSPQNLAQKAESLGMVSNENPAYLRLSDGAVLGHPVPASADAKIIGDGGNGVIPNSILTQEMTKIPKENIEVSPSSPAPIEPSAGTVENPSVPQFLTNGLPAVQTR